MTRTDIEEIKRYIGIVAEDFKSKLDFVIDAQLELKKDVAELKKDVAELKKDVAELKKDVAELKKDVRELKDRMTNVEAELVSHRDNTEMHTQRAKRKRKTSA